jgi:uncharacterized protein YegP (UPF0339 family)
MQFVIYRDNGAQFHCRLMGADGRRLADSAVTFSPAEDARRATGQLREQAGSATGTEG